MKHTLLISLILQFLLAAQAFYSISYSSGPTGGAKIHNTGAYFVDSPSKEQVADLYLRVSGLPPILSENNLNLPTADLLSTQELPSILEVHGGRLPTSVISIAKATAFDNIMSGPSAEDVGSILHAHGVSPIHEKMMGDPVQISNWIQRQQRPVVILHHETPSTIHYQARRLANSTVTPLTEFQISQYQICLWTGLGIVLLLLASVCAIVNMDVVPDSLLYAKFQSARTNKHD